VSAVQIVSTALLGLGAVVMLTGAAGVMRFPDFYTRLHAAGKGDTLGQGLVLAGLACTAGFGIISLKLVFILLFVFVLNPTATHALARGAWISGLVPWSTGGALPADEEERGGEEDHA
jgi:multicomponent Na+:H+ antiporter subunit G